MHFSPTLLASFLALVSAAPSNPKVLAFPFTRHQQDSALVQHHLQLSNHRPDPVFISNEFQYYSIDLTLGTPAQKFNVLLDTGSSDLWVYNVSDTTDCAGGACKNTGTFDSSKSSTYHSIDDKYFIQYVSGNASGNWGTDTLSLEGVSLPDFRFATIDNAQGNTGILGVSLPGSESVRKGESTYDNFPIALQKAGYIDRRVYSLYLNDTNAFNGTFLLGGIDHAKFNGSLTVLPLPSPDEFAVKYENIILDGKPIAKPGYTVLDSGTSFSYIPETVYNTIAKKHNLGDVTFFGLPSIDCKANVSLDFEFDGVTIHAQREQLIIDPGIGFCFFGVLPSTYSQNITLFGDTFLRNAYVVYDLEDLQIGIAQAVYTDKTDIRPVTGPLK
ncbi:aspartic peptidase domain-containing protein [Yarrowia lipolytica]|uniref:YALI0C20273p n=2 Tax=Yarrowia lipolytica TaxID=4952 RepID=Q6CBB7_YARLI|nr:YALI0C20273p [Yarrowia lipolytica CLIB122]AOW03152.1 hypothetical protein YALI1_C28370g [Yarrowia lipolytica]KAB8281417.1 aspartic peptidase domain-containing protein [Yarrowia lipolytica]KAE8173037.1 aspartic peptidase domain-containing protein [Yarrowia lipolytica]KAJ8053658.1 aspartic peptidase domain-containing protein [Yarrowia lipolytica]RDW23336.1 aspartic peptidase domain-containing protein [Yarrowia lipolytica]|eukprot:XP_502045.1 YALI0C20273p [Yarrowia lipolytica CLIB122]